MLPQDIRLLNTSLHERLSPASAGMVGDDHADAQLIKEDWVRREARRAATTGRQRLKYPSSITSSGRRLISFLVSELARSM